MLLADYAGLTHGVDSVQWTGLYLLRVPAFESSATELSTAIPISTIVIMSTQVKSFFVYVGPTLLKVSVSDRQSGFNILLLH